MSFYNEAVLIYPGDMLQNAFGRVLVFPDQALKLAIANVADIDVEYLISCAPGIAAISKLNDKDLGWVRKKFVKTEALGGAYPCDYEAVLFNTENKTSVSQLLDELKKLFSQLLKLSEANDRPPQEEFDSLQQKVNDKVEQLRKKQVLILAFCSC